MYNICIACITGYEIDVLFTDGTGNCVLAGKASYPISTSDSLYNSFASTVCPALKNSGTLG